MSVPRVAILILAAGRSSRMGGPNKLLATFDGVPLIRRSVETALASRAARVFVVLGHQGERLRDALGPCDAELLDNPAYAEGLSSSLRLGFDAAAGYGDGVLVILADQPALEPAHLDALIEAFRPEGSGSIVVAIGEGKRGNPVVLSSRFAAQVSAITGDKGARDLIRANEALVREVEIGPAALLDVDTPDLLRAAGGVIAPDAVPRRS